MNESRIKKYFMKIMGKFFTYSVDTYGNDSEKLQEIISTKNKFNNSFKGK